MYLLFAAGTVTISTLERLNEDYMTEKLNIADHITTTGHNIKWDNFDINASGKTDYHCKIKEPLYI